METGAGGDHGVTVLWRVEVAARKGGGDATILNLRPAGKIVKGQMKTLDNATISSVHVSTHSVIRTSYIFYEWSFLFLD